MRVKDKSMLDTLSTLALVERIGRIFVMRKHIPIALISVLLSSAAFAHQTIGYFETKSTAGGARNRICIKVLPDTRLDIYIATAYCPSTSGECYNTRIDQLSFQAPLKANTVHYKDKSDCEVVIRFKNNGAEVTQNAHCSNDEHPYLYASGFYKLIKAEVNDEDCAP